MQQELEKQGKVIVGSCIPGAPCVASQIKTEMAKNIKALKEAEAIWFWRAGWACNLSRIMTGGGLLFCLLATPYSVR